MSCAPLCCMPKSPSERPPTNITASTPTHIPVETINARRMRALSTSPRVMRARPAAASSGTAHCTTTSDIETVRNLSYPGSHLKSSSVNHIMWLPQAMNSVNSIAPAIHHLSLAGSSIKAISARNIAAAPR